MLKKISVLILSVNSSVIMVYYRQNKPLVNPSVIICNNQQNEIVGKLDLIVASCIFFFSKLSETF